ncbi:MAG TPA: RNA 3'-terminal phosphate cyclase, partial [Gemmataceae bacterium]|nr:RNA 3'-terminal phosphate cyclase [Gemmataceae bacterium]
MTQIIELDGALGEGGGQILRTSLSLSLITGRPFRLRNIRAGRPRPGLRPQHLTSVQAAAAIGQATVRGACVDSIDITFEPGKVVPGKYHFPIGTAGATSLVLHTIYLPLALAGGGPSELTLEGGTHVSTSPCFDFLKTTWLPYTELCGLHIDLRLHRRGFYPRGGGLIQATIQPCPRLHGLQLTERSPLRTASCISAVASLPDHIAKRQAERA